MKTPSSPRRRQRPPHRTLTSHPMRQLTGDPAMPQSTAAGPQRDTVGPVPATDDESPVPGSSRPAAAAPDPAERSAGPGADLPAPGADEPADPREFGPGRPIAFPNVDARSTTYRAKAARMVRLLGSHSGIVEYLRGRQCEIVLQKRLLDPPAEILDRGNRGGDEAVLTATGELDRTVTVYLAAYYFEEYSMGYLAGMLCHEFAVHDLADFAGSRFNDGLHGAPEQVPGGKLVDPTRVDHKDHAVAAMPESTRHRVYRRVVLEMADLLFQDWQATPPRGTLEEVTDLLDCYLMDLATIAATNDDRYRGIPMVLGSRRLREEIVAAYQEYKARLWRDPEVSDTVKALLPRDKTTDAVEQQFLTIMGNAMRGTFRSPSLR